MKRIIFFLIIMALPLLLFSQEEKSKVNSKNVKTSIPVQAQYSNVFKIKNVNFNKRIDISGKGELLEIEFIIKNLTDEPMDFYIFTVATFEKNEKTKSSFERPIPEKERVRTFVPYPNDIKNFQYPVTDDKGVQIKDNKGKLKVQLLKFPKDPKAGINPDTGKLYHLEKKLLIRTYHLSPYRAYFYYFNEVALLIFDKDGKPVYRKLFTLNGYRR